ncbi:MAG TPA: hypothetical protein VJ483_07355 [Holophagaceae bacterium]|nr:hypothetical protein [Holophagaceae bacterium]
MLLPLPFQVPAIHSPAPPASAYADCETQLLDRLDLGQPLGPTPALRGRDRAAYLWLATAATWKPGRKPLAPFAPGSAELREAQDVQALLKGPAPSEAAVAKLSLKLAGSRLLLWRWMKARELESPLDLQLRRAIEARLLEPGPALIQGWALRHALCFSVAERDQAHFAALRRAHGAQAQSLFSGFQSLFALLDGPSPIFRTWRLPELDYRDQGLGDLGARRIWVAPFDTPPPRGTAWIIPSATGQLGTRESQLRGVLLKEAEGLAAKLRAMSRQACFVASSREWERQGLAYFPILIELDASKNIIAIEMGDAAPIKP